MQTALRVALQEPDLLLDLSALGAADLTGKARAVGQLVGAGVAVEDDALRSGGPVVIADEHGGTGAADLTGGETMTVASMARLAKDGELFVLNDKSARGGRCARAASARTG